MKKLFKHLLSKDLLQPWILGPRGPTLMKIISKAMM